MYELMNEAPGEASRRGGETGRGWSLLWRQPSAEVAATIYFAVVPVFVGTNPLLHYAFVDEAGDVLLTAFTRRPGVESTAREVTPSRTVELIEPRVFDRLAARVCAGATLVGFQRVRQGGLLPDGALAASQGLECACRRFQQVVRARAVDLTEDGELTLDACLRGVGLPVEPGPNAIAYALGVRELWRWARPLAVD